MARKTSDGRSASEFAERVLNLLVAARKGMASAEQDRDTRRVAFGLAFIAGAVQQFSRKVPGAEYGANEALAIIKAITSGQDHPVWDYLDGVRSFNYKPQHAPKTEIDAQRQYMVLGAVRAYKEASLNCKDPEAARAVARACRLPDVDLNPVLIVKSWIKYTADDADAQRAIKLWARVVAQMARTIPCAEPIAETDKLLEASRRLIWRGWSVPFALDQKS